MKEFRIIRKDRQGNFLCPYPNCEKKFKNNADMVVHYLSHDKRPRE
jgi:hypothetical protein